MYLSYEPALLVPMQKLLYQTDKIENLTNCEALFSVETSCSGETVNTYTITPGSNLTLNTKELPEIGITNNFALP